MFEKFAGFTDTNSAPARDAFTVMPDDTAALAQVSKALYVGTGGDVTLRPVDAAADVVFKNVASGQVLDVCAAYVRATGTTAADIVALA